MTLILNKNFPTFFFFKNCRKLIIATGVATPVIPTIGGMEYTDGYEDMSLDREDFEGQTVLILGECQSLFGLSD